MLISKIKVCVVLYLNCLGYRESRINVSEVLEKNTHRMEVCKWRLGRHTVQGSD